MPPAVPEGPDPVPGAAPRPAALAARNDRPTDSWELVMPRPVLAGTRVRTVVGGAR